MDTPLPCCSTPTAKYQKELAHVYSFDFDLFQCTACAKYWVWAFSAYGSGWEPVTEEDAATMLALDEAGMRPFMRKWAESFN